MTATSLVSFQMGWWPPARSMMLSLRIPSASPGARGFPARKPSSSGPRWRIAAVMARTRDSASLVREANATPHIPHTLLFDFRRREEGGTRTDGVLSQMEARDSQAVVRIPGEPGSQEQEEHRRHGGEHQIEKRFALQQQAPIDRFLPARVDPIHQRSKIQPVEGQPRQPNMCEAVVIVLARIVRDDADRLGKHGRILQFLAR